MPASVRWSTTAVVFITVACSDRPEPMQSAAFTDAFEQVTTITPEQSDSQPIVKISGIDRDREGNLLISDNAEGRVSLFASDGRLLRTIAKKGNGPGEMQYPFDPRSHQTAPSTFPTSSRAGFRSSVKMVASSGTRYPRAYR